MSKAKTANLKPFISLLIIVLTMFFVVFFKMEVRRVGYSILKDIRTYKSLQDKNRLYMIDYAKALSPHRLKSRAQSQLTLSEARRGQIIHISGDNIALEQ